MTKIIVYKITNLINNKCYVGITSYTLQFRWKAHKYKSNKCRRLKNSIRKHGENNFKVEELYTCFSVEHANEMEQYFIELYNSLSPNGYNLRSGGKYGKPSEETKEKISKSHIKRLKEPELLQQRKESMDKRWASSEREKLTIKAKATGLKLRVPLVSVNTETLQIVRYEKWRDAQELYTNIDKCISGINVSSGGYCWFYDKGQSEQELINSTKQKMDSRRNKPRDTTTIRPCDNTLREEARGRFVSIVRVNIETLEVQQYENVNDAVRSGYSTTPIYSSLKGELKKTHKNIWFYYTPDTDFVELAKNRLNSLKSK